MSKEIINYSQCWEDPTILLRALKISKNDIVLSITSGGDNTLSIVSKDPKKIETIDTNSAQNYLFDLKLSAIHSLSYDEVLEFLGLSDSTDRIGLFKKLKGNLNSKSFSWWLSKPTLIEKGVIHVGKLERFLNGFRRFVLPLIHAQSTIEEFCSQVTLRRQQVFYAKFWNTWKWRAYFKISSHPFVLNRFARQKEMTSNVSTGIVTTKYFDRLEKSLNQQLLSNNYFMTYCLKGSFSDTKPHYLNADSYNNIRASKTAINVTTIDALSFLKSAKTNTFSKYNLSDIFEALPPKEYEMLWEEIVRTAKNNATVAYWNNLIKRPLPYHLKQVVREDMRLSKVLSNQDRVFFYDGFHVCTIIKK